jgi:microcystin-dependent protein
MPDVYMGTIALVGFNFAPQGWALCDGQILSIAQNTALFTLLGATYGGNGQTTFALPNIKASSLQEGLNYIIAVQGIYPSRG